jgi:xanthine dehydrogenase small subunit
MRNAIRFLRRGRPVEIADFEPTTMLLDYLRLTEGKRGTKEGCAEGDCGACTIALGRRIDGRLVYRPVNACILLLGMADGAEVVTLPMRLLHPRLRDEPLHPLSPQRNGRRKGGPENRE